jgi:DNA-binding CsgD family transcriptional regulator
MRRSLASIQHESELILAEVVAGDAKFVLMRRPLKKRLAFTSREQEILNWVGEGMPTKAIAAKLGITTTTVDTHIRRMFRKHRVRSRAALVRKATLLS